MSSATRTQMILQKTDALEGKNDKKMNGAGRECTHMFVAHTRAGDITKLSRKV
jgi:hypothetical protein